MPSPKFNYTPYVGTKPVPTAPAVTTYDSGPDKPDFWLVYSPRGTQPPRVRHSTSESAQAEAARLADKFRDRHFYVMKSEIAYINTRPEPQQVRPTATEVSILRGLPRTMVHATPLGRAFLRTNDIIQPVLPPVVKTSVPGLPPGAGMIALAKQVKQLIDADNALEAARKDAGIGSW